MSSSARLRAVRLHRIPPARAAEDQHKSVVLTLVALAIVAVIAGCYGTVSMSVPIGGGYHGPYRSVGISSRPIFF